MRKILFSLLLILAIAMPAAAEHARFLGIEINGSQEQFKRQLLSVGGIKCLESRCDDKGYVYTGSYAGYNNCEFYTLEKCGNVYCVVVYLPEASSWRQIKRQYNQICGEYNSDSAFRLTKQEASFEAPYAEGDGDEMLAVANEKVSYVSVYDNSSTTIIVKISKFKQVKIIVSDKENFAREEPEAHMLFMGLPITGTPGEFANRLMREKGFTLKERTPSGSVLVTGRFAGFDNCTVGVMLDDNDGGINIGVLFPKCTSWATLKSQYFALKAHLGNKYTQTYCDESFSDSYYDGCGRELEAIRNEQIHYVTKYNAENGTVAITISNECRICILYLPD